MDAVALSNEEQKYFETGGEAGLPDANTQGAQEDNAGVSQNADAPVADPTLEENQQPERDERGRFVPHQALHAEREERKKAQEALRQMQERQAVLEDRWNTLLKAGQQQPEAPKGPPDPNEDIFGAIKWQQEQILASQKQAEDSRKQQEERTQYENQEREIVSHWKSSVQEFSSRETDFQNAADWLSEYRHKQLEALTPFDPRMGNPAERNAQIDAELKQIIAVSRQNGQNPAEMVFQLAKSWGYGGQPAPQAPNKDLLDNINKLETAQNRSRTLSATNGKTPGDDMTIEAIASMSNDEFAAWSENPANERMFRRLMGG